MNEVGLYRTHCCKIFINYILNALHGKNIDLIGSIWHKYTSPYLIFEYHRSSIADLTACEHHTGRESYYIYMHKYLKLLIFLEKTPCGKCN